MTKHLTTNAPATDIPVPGIPFLRLKTGSAAKLGARSQGAVAYEVLTDLERRQIHLRLTANSGGGNHSLEAVPFATVQSIVNGLEAGAPFASRVFRGAFRGGSQNNPGFLACLLRTEGLLAAAEGKAFQHVVSGDWSAWADALLTQPGEAVELPLKLAQAALPADTAAPSLPGRRGRRKSRVEEADDACAAH